MILPLRGVAQVRDDLDTRLLDALNQILAERERDHRIHLLPRYLDDTVVACPPSPGWKALEAELGGALHLRPG